MIRKSCDSILIKGFTLVEILIVCALVVLIGSVISSLGRDIFVNNYYAQKSLVAEGDAKSAMAKMVKELRETSPAETGAYPIELASTTEIIFYGDTNNDGLNERVRYFLDDRALKRGLVNPTGQPLAYNTDAESVSTLANDMVNQLVFSYYDRSYDGTASSSPLVQPVAVENIRLIKVELLIDANPNRSPVPLYLTSQVGLRNLKDNW
ncbi:MAG: type II secretion system protein [Candidatus Paceibacterota bacterium]|jgi:type II secretory pathway pseudopilin PulG